MKHNVKIVAIGAAVGVLAVAVAACGTGSSPRTLRLGIHNVTGSLSPFSGLKGEYPTLANIWPALVTYDLSTHALQPSFASSYEKSSDGRTWTFHTRSGAKWSDGQPLTAKDAAFTLETIVRYKTGATANYAQYVTHLVSAQATDPNTLVLRYDTAIPTVLSQAGVIPILPEHVWSRFATNDGKGLQAFANLPSPGHPVVSGGPFMLTQQKKDEFELFQRNPDYFGSKPPIDAFGLQYYGTNDALVSALKSKQIDAIEGVPPTAVNTLKAAGFMVSGVPSLNSAALLVNPNPTKRSHRELLDPKVRQALELGIDRNAITKVVYLGHASPGGSIIPPAMGQWHDAALHLLGFDPAGGNAILDKLGYKKGSDGIRIAAGHPMSYEMITTPDFQRTFQIIQAGFQQLGVQLTAQTVDQASELSAVEGSDKQYLNYDFASAIDGLGGAGGFDPNFRVSQFICKTRGIYNRSGYCNPTYDRLFVQQGLATDPSTRLRLIKQMQQMIYASRAYISLAYPDHLDAWSSKWTGFQQSPEGIFGVLAPHTLTQVHKAG